MTPTIPPEQTSSRGAQLHPASDSAGHRFLAELLRADSLIELTETALAAIADVDRLLIVGWRGPQLWQWGSAPAISPDTQDDEAFARQLIRYRDQLTSSTVDDRFHEVAASLGYDEMAVIDTHRDIAFHLFCTYKRGISARPSLSQSALCADLTLALCNYTRLEELRELSHNDPLTGLFNRRYFGLRLTEEVARAKRFGRQLALAVADLDRFKSLNDSHGHQAGDIVLRYLGQSIRRSVRSIDIVCRLGGDEFVILMPDTEAKECAQLADRLRRTVSAGRLTLGGRAAGECALDLRLSIGAAVYPEHADRAERLLWYADMALLTAKRNGGDQFVLSDPAEMRRGSAL